MSIGNKVYKRTDHVALPDRFMPIVVDMIEVEVGLVVAVAGVVVVEMVVVVVATLWLRLWLRQQL